MIVRICFFTEKGNILADRINSLLDEHIIEIKDKDKDTDSWIRESFELRLPVVFIGACGIAIRKIAPYIKDKLTDSAVIVIDEMGRYVIPVLSGHMGGANELAEYIAVRLNAEAVITTATDVENVFAVDTFAKENGYRIFNRNGIRKISSKILSGQKLKWKYDIKDDTDADVLVISQKAFAENARGNCFINEPKEDLVLIKKPYTLGIGCKKNTDVQDIEKTVFETLTPLGINEDNINDFVYKVSSIDLKKKEYGLNLFLQKYGIGFECFDAHRLSGLEGNFTQSEFVNLVTGTDNVCERSAVMAAGDGAKLIIKKNCGNGVTVAVAQRLDAIERYME